MKQNLEQHDQFQSESIRLFFDETLHADGAIPLNLIRAEHYLPALDFALAAARKRINAIKTNEAAPNFENVILALETATDELDRVSSVYGNLKLTEGNEEYSKIGEIFYPKISEFFSDVSLDPLLFARVKSVYDRRQDIIDPEELRLLEKTYQTFRRNGANLSPQDAERLRQIDQESAVLGPQFSDRVLAATNQFELVIIDPDELSGLPEGTQRAAEHAAQAKGISPGWVFNLQGPSYVPFVTFSKRRELREKMWRAYATRCFHDKFDNQEAVVKILKLRHERAKLLGYENHPAYVLEQRMAKSQERVHVFLENLLEPSLHAAKKELEELKKFALETEGITDLKPWDIGYFVEKLKEKKFAFSSEELRPYFQTEKVVKGVFDIAQKLFHISFTERNDIPTYNPEVKAFEIKDSKSNEYIGLLFLDLFPRTTKKPGAWMTAFREQGFQAGKPRRPHISIVCNFTRPTPSHPSLLTYDEVKTLFHEFGHALHGLLSQCKFRSMGGTNVYWDFVELPSQLMENWAEEIEGLSLFAKHYQTGELIPADLVKKIEQSEKFMAGWYSLRQLQFALLDMQWHTVDPNSIHSVSQFENEAIAKYRVLPVPKDTNVSCSFAHIFAGGYSAGYYSYKWAEVLEADAFEYFKERGIFDPEVAEKYRKFILEKGDSAPPMELYKQFRGREPDESALLRRDGLI